MQSLSKQTERIEWIDTAKGIGIILVFLGHLDTSPLFSGWIYSFHIPLFFFLSGLVFSSYKKNIKKFASDEFKRMVIPYYCWAIIWFVISRFAVDRILHDNSFEIKNDFISFIYMGREGTIWFLSALLTVHIFVYLLTKLTKNNEIILLIISILTFFGFYFYYKFGGIDLWFNIDAAFMALPFFVIGYCLNKNKIIIGKITELSNIKKISIAAIFLILNILFSIISKKISGIDTDMNQDLYGNPFFMLLSALFGIAATVLFSQMLNLKMIKYIGKNSMVYFVMHQNIIAFANRFFGVIGFNPNSNLLNKMLYLIAMTVLIFTLLTIVNEIIMRTPFADIFGVKRKNKKSKA